MTRQSLKNSIKETYKQAISIIEKKNNDYAKNDDGISNFKLAIAVGVSIERGILVRMMDKMSRISNLLDKEGDVKNESIQDTLLDLCNYSAILKAIVDEKRSRTITNRK